MEWLPQQEVCLLLFPILCLHARHVCVGQRVCCLLVHCVWYVRSAQELHREHKLAGGVSLEHMALFLIMQWLVKVCMLLACILW